MKKVFYKAWLLTVLVAVIAAVCVGAMFSDSAPYSLTGGLSQPVWYCANGEKVSFPHTPEHNSAGRIYTILGEINNEDVIIVKCNFDKISASVDGEEIYSASVAKLGRLSTVVGNYRAFIPMKEQYANKKLSLHIVPRRSAYTVSVKDISLGTMEAYAVTEFTDNLLSLLIGLVLILMAVVSLGVWLCCKLSKNMRLYTNLDDFLYIMLTSLTLGVWIISYVHIFELLNGRMAFTGIINYISFMMIPFCVSGLLMALANKRNKFINFVHYAVGLIFVLQIALFMTGVCDLSDSLLISHGICVFVMGEIVYLIIKGITSKTPAAKKLALPAYACIIALCAVAIVMYVMDKEWMIYVCIALCILMATMFGESAGGLYHLIKENIKTEEFRRHAFTDALTGLSSRYSYETHIEKLKSEPLDDNFTVVVMDLNKLKATNDTYGHAAGDEIIKGAAMCINDAFSHLGTCYRTGGDEFVVFTVCDEAVLMQAFEHFDAMVGAWKGDIIDSFRVSYGWVSSRDNRACSVEELIKIADDQMYEVKRGYYINAKK